MSHALRTAVVVFAAATSAAAAPPPQDRIDDAVRRGNAFLRQRYGVDPPPRPDGNHGVGPAALAGLALLETGTPPDHPAVRAVAGIVRDNAFGEYRTYQSALSVLFLDRLGDPADVPLVQLLGVRLLAGQNPDGGWTYHCTNAVTPEEAQALRAGFRTSQLTAGRPLPVPKGGPPAVPLHPVVERYARGVLANAAARNDRWRGGNHDDNSNSQFGILGVWVARRHGLPVDAALARLERRYLATQTADGGWPYSGAGGGSPSMTCVGLMGLATALARKEERLLKATPAAKPAPAKPVPQPPPGTDPNDPFFKPPPKAATPTAPPAGSDPFFNPPAKPEPPPVKPPAARPPPPEDAVTVAIKRGMENLGRALDDRGRGRALLTDHDYYFLWSVERVGVVYGVDRIGGADWFAVGAAELLDAQEPGGAWEGRGFGTDVTTAFALLFLARSNLVRDLASKVQRQTTDNEMRTAAKPPAPAPPPAAVAPAKPPESVAVKPAEPVLPTPVEPAAPVQPPPARPASSGATALAAALAQSSADEWTTALARLRDAKGADHTAALALAAARLDGDRRRQAREALAARLSRMTAATLRGSLDSDDAELRRGAALACGMKDDPAHVPDLIRRLTDPDDGVGRAARAALKSLTGQDHGPRPGATADQRQAAADAWSAWWVANGK